MPFLPVPLGTDVLVYLLLAVAAGFAWYVRRHEHLRLPWLRVARSPAAMSALVPLVVFLAVGILDSVHFRPSLPAAPRTQAQSERAAARISSISTLSSLQCAMRTSPGPKTTLGIPAAS